MANTVNLNAGNPNDVNCAQKVSVLTGEPNTWLLIYSGVAFQRQRAEGSSGFLGIGENSSETDATVNVTLDNISGVLLQYAAMGSMSNITEENTWGQWTIETTSLALRDNGDLVFTADTTVTGIGDAEFYSFCYYVSAKVVLDAASISGRIRWKRTLMQPLNPPHFVISANTQSPAPSGSLLGGLQVVASGVEGNLDSSDTTYYYVPYTIMGPLLAKTLMVTVSPIAGSFSAVTGGTLNATQISGPDPINLTISNRHATNVDFEIDLQQFPK